MTERSYTVEIFHSKPVDQSIRTVYQQIADLLGGWVVGEGGRGPNYNTQTIMAGYTRATEAQIDTMRALLAPYALETARVEAWDEEDENLPLVEAECINLL